MDRNYAFVASVAGMASLVGWHGGCSERCIPKLRSIFSRIGAGILSVNDAGPFALVDKTKGFAGLSGT